MAKGKARGFEALMGWLSGRGVDPDQAEALLRSLPNVDGMTPADLQRVIDQMNAPAPRARMDSPVSVEDRVAGNPQTGMRPDPNIRSTLQELDPEFSASIDTASPEEIMAAYRNAVNRAEGVRRGAPRQGVTRVMDTPVGAVPPPQGPVRQMELPLGPGAPEPNIRELLGPSQRMPQTPQEQIASQFDAVTGSLGRDPFSAPRSPQPPLMLADDLADGPYPGMPTRMPEVVKPAVDEPRIPYGAIGAGIATGLGLTEAVRQFGGGQPPAAQRVPPAAPPQEPPRGSTTADLVEESRPAPKVEVTEETPQPTVKQGPPDYSAQARQLIARANDIQRQAGRQTPESIALINQANRLYEMAADGRRNGSQPAIMPVEQQNRQTSSIQRNAQEQIAQNQGTDYRSQARRMMAELNIRSSQGNISSAEYSAMKRRIDELFALADREDNARRNPIDRRPNTGGGMGRAQFPPTRRLQTRRSPSTT